MLRGYYHFTGSLPDLDRIYDPEMALPSDMQWLRDNPEAVARVRVFRDDTRLDRRVLLLAFRVIDPTQPDGWRVCYHEGHTAHHSGFPFGFWEKHPNPSNANRIALIALTADADAEAGGAHAILGGLVVPDLSEMDPYWKRQFTPLNADADADVTAPTTQTPDLMEADLG